MSANRPASIVVAHHPALDVFSAAHRARLAEIGEVLNVEPITDWTTDEAIELLARCTVICGHWGCPPITDMVLEHAPSLGLVAYAAGTVKGVVAEAAWHRGVRVTSGAVANAEPVAQFTLAAVVFANKQVLWRAGDADPAATFGAMSLQSPVGNYDKTIGIVGASMTGRRVIELLRVFDRLDTIVYDPFLDDAEARRLGVTKVDLDELCAAADIVSIHAPALPSTHHMIGADQLGAMRDGATLINTARGSLVNHDALADHVRQGRLFAILDVTDPEPLTGDHELRSLPNVFITPHLAGSQGSELGRLADHAIDEVRRWVAGEDACNEVTLARLAHLA